MKKLIGYCGIDCQTCDAYIATINNDDTLREKTAKLWAELNNAPILPEHIHCHGCRVDGVKTIFCESLCAIRKCAVSKGIATCSACEKMSCCEALTAITSNNPEAKNNLLSLEEDDGIQ